MRKIFNFNGYLFTRPLEDIRNSFSLILRALH